MRDSKMSTNQIGQRRRFIIDPTFQWKYCAIISVTIFMVSCLVSILLYGVLHQQARLRAMNPLTYTANVTGVLIVFGVGFAALAAVAVGLCSIVMTHRICGPLWLLHSWLSELKDGRFPRLRPIRRKDEFGALFRTFADAIHTLKQREQADIASLNEALDLARTVVNRDEPGRKDALTTLILQIEDLRRRKLERSENEAGLGPAPNKAPAPANAQSVGSLA